MDRTVVFLDAGFLDKVADQHRVRFDYQRLPQVAASGGKLIRSYYYYCMPYQGSPPTGEESTRYKAFQGFIHMLGRLGSSCAPAAWRLAERTPLETLSSNKKASISTLIDEQGGDAPSTA